MTHRAIPVLFAVLLSWQPCNSTFAQGTSTASATPAASTIPEDARIQFGPGQSRGAGENIGSAGTFSAELWLSPSRAFIEDWKKPSPVTLLTSRHPSRDSALFTVILFSGAQAGPDGLCSVTYDVSITAPDGSLYAEHKNVVGFQGLAPADANALQLAHDYVGIGMGQREPNGIYTVNVVVKDNIARVEVPLKTTFVLQ